jgi:hypothetical protein
VARAPARNDMMAHMDDAFRACHPFQDPRSGLRPHLEETVRRLSAMTPEAITELRVLAEIRDTSIAETQAPLTAWLRERMPPHVFLVSGGMDLGLWAAYLDGFPDWPHRHALYDLVYGFTIIGDPVPDTGLFRPIDRRPTADAAAVLATNDQEVERQIIKSRRAAARDPETARALVAVTRKEVEKGIALGPFSRKDLDDLWGTGGWRPMYRFAVYQGKVRPCDDAKDSLHNAIVRRLETYVHHAKADFGLRVARAFSTYLDVDRLGMEGGSDDVGDAYKVIGNGQPWFAVATLVDPDLTSAEARDDCFYVIPGHNFGLVSAVTNFNAPVEFSTFVAASTLLVVTDHMFDDLPTVDRAGFAKDAQRANCRFHERMGLAMAESKHQEASSLFKFQGLWTDFTRSASHGTMRLVADEDRILDCIDTIGTARRSGCLSNRGALQLQGRAGFTLHSQFSKVGRAALPSLYWHTRSPGTSISGALDDALAFLGSVLVDLEPFEAQIRASLELQALVWTDAMFERAGVRLPEPEPDCDCSIGLVVWCPRRRRFYVGQRDLPLELLALCFGSRETYIGQAELLAAAAAYWTCPWAFRDSYPLHFIDNQGALGILTRGASHHRPMGRLSHQVAAQHLSLRARVWYEYVASAANIADLPSRRDSRLACRMIRARYGAHVSSLSIVLPPLTVTDD